MKKQLLFLLLFIISSSVIAQSVQVPDVIYFGGLKLKLTNRARKIVQTDVDNILRNPKYLQIKIDRANIYFPVIEKIFKEEGIPDDFKYLSLQESSLVPDAVSSSNAVGYWQFKKESAQEVGMSINHEVDERMNIVASSRGAAKYLKRNNAVLNNWIYALLSYNLGLGGVKSKVKDKYVGATEMEIDDDMHWYVLRFLAHKIAFENYVGKTPAPITLVEFGDCHKKSLKDISGETNIPLETLIEYNKWLLKNKVPDDKNYVVVLPVNSDNKDLIAAVTKNQSTVTQQPVKNKDRIKVKLNSKTEILASLPEPSQSSSTEDNELVIIVEVNGVKAIKAREGDTPARLALRAGIAVDALLKYNELRKFDKINPGQFYYLQMKRTKALVLFHTVQEGETVWSIAQKYGIKTSALRAKNRMEKNESLKPGRVLWLKRKRPKNTPVEIKKIEPVKITEKVQVAETGKSSENKVVKQDSIKVNNDSNKNEIKETVVNNTASVDVSETDGEYHLVKAGETLYSISKLYNVSPDSIKAWNNLENNAIQVGQKLKITIANQKTGYIIHEVKQGDTLYKITREYGITIDELKMWNDKQDLNLKIGEQLKIYKK
ncbi:MAG TPA: LysM peptidoglycan-binding domain-containing protein [Cytophagaceae bacterium]